MSLPQLLTPAPHAWRREIFAEQGWLQERTRAVWAASPMGNMIFMFLKAAAYETTQCLQ